MKLLSFSAFFPIWALKEHTLFWPGLLIRARGYRSAHSQNAAALTLTGYNSHCGMCWKCFAAPPRQSFSKNICVISHTWTTHTYTHTVYIHTHTYMYIYIYVHVHTLFHVWLITRKINKRHYSSGVTNFIEKTHTYEILRAYSSNARRQSRETGAGETKHGQRPGPLIYARSIDRDGLYRKASLSTFLWISTTI